PREIRLRGCDILLSCDAGTIGSHQPSVVLSQDLLSYEPGEMRRFGISKARIRLILLRYIQARSLKRATAAIFLTHYAARIIQKFTGPLSRIAVIPHGVGESFRHDGRRRDWPAPGAEIRCLYVSNTEMYKHQWHVVRAIGELRRRGHNVSLTLAGGGSGPAQHLLNAEIERTDPNRQFIKDIGAVPHDGIPGLLTEADLFVFASSCENMPVTLIEAMASGVPIASSNRGPMPEVLANGGVYFDPEDPLSIAEAVGKIVTESGLRREIAAQGARLARQYSWERCAAETWAFLRDNSPAWQAGPAVAAKPPFMETE
ncbi:MAG TPA: glycosyltransferase family 1 protein, partial [Steroidobacteraceae bacterium]